MLINSVMSLQKVTLYYWGQNRLLNVLPLATAWLKDPAANLSAVLFLTSLSLFSLLYLLARLAALVTVVPNVGAASLKTFIVISAAFVITLKPHAISEIAIGHIEYSLAALLWATAVYLTLTRRSDRWQVFALPTSLIVLAIGLNPSTVIPAVFVAVASAWYRKKVGLAEWAWGASAVLSFVGWGFIARQHGETAYNQFDLSLLATGLGRVSERLVSVVNHRELLIFAGILAALQLCARAAPPAARHHNSPLSRYVGLGVVVFSVGWILLFAASRWIERNDFAWRYFTYVIFGLFFIAAIFCTRVLADLRARYANFAVMAAALAAGLATFTPPTTWAQFQVFQRANALTRTGSSLYTGDYWVVWPSVLRDMMHGHEAYGLTYRGEANKTAARAYLLKKIQAEGHATVSCLNEEPDTCIQQIKRAVGNFQVTAISRLKDDVHQVQLSGYDTGLHMDGADLPQLPSAVGILSNGAWRSDGRRGFLVFGPHYPIDAGSYRLSVRGSSTSAKVAYVDVASHHGNQVHARFELSPNASGVLIQDALIHLPADAPDLEVRIWVDQGHSLEVTGYRLELLQGKPGSLH